MIDIVPFYFERNTNFLWFIMNVYSPYSPVKWVVNIHNNFVGSVADIQKWRTQAMKIIRLWLSLVEYRHLRSESNYIIASKTTNIYIFYIISFIGCLFCLDYHRHDVLITMLLKLQQWNELLRGPELNYVQISRPPTFEPQIKEK